MGNKTHQTKASLSGVKRGRTPTYSHKTSQAKANHKTAKTVRVSRKTTNSRLGKVHQDQHKAMDSGPTMPNPTPPKPLHAPTARLLLAGVKVGKAVKCRTYQALGSLGSLPKTSNAKPSASSSPNLCPRKSVTLCATTSSYPRNNPLGMYSRGY